MERPVSGPKYDGPSRTCLLYTSRFRAQNGTDLILYLRYNNGGDVLSSTVLCTLIAGEAYKGQLYAHMTLSLIHI